MKDSTAELNFIGLKREKIFASREFRQVQKHFPKLREAEQILVSEFEKIACVYFTDSEVAYLTLHFGAFLKIAEKNNQRLRILIVCVNSVSTGNMLRHEIEKLLPEAEIVGLVAAVNAFNAQEGCDLIISTAPIKSIVPAIIVHPILTDDDRKFILDHRLVQHFCSARFNTACKARVTQSKLPATLNRAFWIC